MTLTPSDRVLFDALCWRVRNLTLAQALRLLALAGSGSTRAARRRLHALARAGLLGYEDAPARPLIDLERPVWLWAPGGPAPDFGALAWELERRWLAPPEPTRVFFAAPRALRVLGGCAKGRLTNLNQLSHDLHVAEVYLRLLAADPALAAGWVSEDQLAADRRKFEKQPDAVLHDPDGTPRLAVEFGGLYGPDKLRAFHEDMDRRGLPYVLR